jgi:hypothetical protein
MSLIKRMLFRKGKKKKEKIKRKGQKAKIRNNKNRNKDKKWLKMCLIDEGILNGVYFLILIVFNCFTHLI